MEKIRTFRFRQPLELVTLLSNQTLASALAFMSHLATVDRFSFMAFPITPQAHVVYQQGEPVW